jgi:CheY-like chemotaxis protein
MLKILLIDDDKINNFLNRSVIGELYDSDCSVTEYTNPEKAYDFLKSCAETEIENTPDVILLDINMPEMSGFELLEKMQEENIILLNTKIFILSSSLDPSDLERSIQFKSVVNFISKPLNSSKLKQHLSS